ncbi:MAG: lytic transglycosylase domain-containing protein [Candidatus Gracilibacteria bacterium]|nr:lytic transglycosylase domain-containing protein [Candidatus Gracilibacteria bacterium]
MNVPPSKGSHSIPHFSQNRRKILGLIGGSTITSLTHNSLAQEQSTEVTEGIKLRFDTLMRRLSFSHTSESKSLKSTRSNNVSTSQKTYDFTQLSSENPEEAKILGKYGGLIARLCRDLDLDMEMMTRLVLHESKGISNVSSIRGAQGLMQIMPPTAQDFVRRYPMYESIFQNISPEILKHLQSTVARKAMKTLTQSGTFSTRTGESAIRSMLVELYNPEVNLIFGHIYFAGLKTQLEPKIEDFQRDLSRYFATLTPVQHQRISASRKAIGASYISLEYLKGNYAKRLYQDSQFALDTESLIQYNGGGNRPKQSYNYAAIIQA